MGFLAPIFAPIAGIFGGGAAGGGIGLGGILGAAGSIVSTIGAVGAANYQAQVAKNNEVIAKENAERASTQAQEEQLRNDQETAALVGEIEAGQGASGLTGASQLRTRRSVARLGKLDSTNIRKQGQENVRNFLQQAENFRGEAGAARSQGLAAMFAGGIDLGRSLLGGASSTPMANRLRSRDPWRERSGQSLRRTI